MGFDPLLYCSCDGLFPVETPVLVWRFSLVSLAPSSLLPLLSFWNSCLDLGPQNCSSYFPHISGLFVFYHWGVFMYFFTLLLCVWVDGGDCSAFLSHYTESSPPLCFLGVLAASASVLPCLTALSGWLNVFLLYVISIFLKLLFFVFAIFLQVVNDCIYASPRSWGLQSCRETGDVGILVSFKFYGRQLSELFVSSQC